MLSNFGTKNISINININEKRTFFEIPRAQSYKRVYIYLLHEQPKLYLTIFQFVSLLFVVFSLFILVVFHVIPSRLLAVFSGSVATFYRFVLASFDGVLRRGIEIHNVNVFLLCSFVSEFQCKLSNSFQCTPANSENREG